MEYIDLNKILTYNRRYNLITGDRSIGKTYALKKYCMDRYIKKKEKFLYIRRRKQDLNKLETFFEKVKQEEFKKGNKQYLDFISNSKDFFYIDDEDKRHKIGTSMSLINVESLKGIDFPVSTIIFDEFTTYSRHTKNETVNFLNLITTITRNDNCRIFLLGNPVEEYSPYFTLLDIHISNRHDKNNIIKNEKALYYNSPIKNKDNMEIELSNKYDLSQSETILIKNEYKQYVKDHVADINTVSIYRYGKAVIIKARKTDKEYTMDNRRKTIFESLIDNAKRNNVLFFWDLKAIKAYSKLIHNG